MDGQAFLRETADLIGTGWCCGAIARNCWGAGVEASDPDATAWSLRGALTAVSERHAQSERALRDALWGISGVIPDESLDAWNDTPGRTQTEALRMLNDAEHSLDENPRPRDGDCHMPI